MMKKMIIPILLCSALFWVCSPPAAVSLQIMKPAEINLPGIKKIAIVDFQGPERSGSQIATLLQSYLMQSDYFEIMERDQLKRILDEQNLGMSGVVDETSAVQVGRLLGVDAMLFGEATSYEVEPDERGTEKVEDKVGTGKYEEVDEKNIFTGKTRKVKKEIMKTVLVDRHYRIRRGTVAINFRVVSVESGVLLAVESESKSYNSGKVIEGSYNTLKPQGEILSDLSKSICQKFARKIAPYYATEKRYIEPGKNEIGAGKKYAESGLWPEAKDAWMRAIQVMPNEPAGYYNLGVAYEMEGDLEEAEIYYKKALSVKQDKRYMDAVRRIRSAQEDQRKLEQQMMDKNGDDELNN